MKILTGLYELITSPSGLFAIMCLIALSIVTWHVAGLAIAWTGFFAVVPGILAICEHREQMATLNSSEVISKIETAMSDNVSNQTIRGKQ
jgi:hypothetical protein